MQDYHISRHDRSGALIGTVSLLAPDDDFARLSAKTMLGTAVTLAVWQDRRFVGTVPQQAAGRQDAPGQQRFTDVKPRVR